MPSSKQAMHDTPSVVFTLCLVVCISVLSMDISLPVFALIAADLGGTPAQAQLIVSMFLVGYAVGQIPVGLLADRFGRLPILYVGIVVFLGSSIFCALAIDFELLLYGRFFQGLSGAAGAVIGRAIIRDISEGKRLSQLMGVLVTSISVMSLLAPILGSLLILVWSWRSTFWTTAVLSVLLLILMKRLISETYPPQAHKHTALQQLKNSFSSFFSTPQCLWGAMLVALPFGGFMVIVSSSSTILVDIYGVTPEWVGLIHGLVVIAYIVGANISRYGAVHWNILKVLKISIVILSIASLYLGILTYQEEVDLVFLWIGFWVYVLGVGIIFPTASGIVMQAVPKTAGFGASIIGTAQMGFAAFTTYVASILYSHSIYSITLILASTGALSVLVYFLGAGIVNRHAERQVVINSEVL